MICKVEEKPRVTVEEAKEAFRVTELEPQELAGDGAHSGCVLQALCKASGESVDSV